MNNNKNVNHNTPSFFSNVNIGDSVSEVFAAYKQDIILFGVVDVLLISTFVQGVDRYISVFSWFI